MTISAPGLGCFSGYIFYVPSWFVHSGRLDAWGFPPADRGTHYPASRCLEPRGSDGCDLLPIFGPDGLRIFLCHPAWATAEGRGLAEARRTACVWGGKNSWRRTRLCQHGATRKISKKLPLDGKTRPCCRGKPGTKKTVLVRQHGV